MSTINTGAIVKFAHQHHLNTETMPSGWVVIYTPGGDPIDGNGMAFASVRALAHWMGY